MSQHAHQSKRMYPAEKPLEKLIERLRKRKSGNPECFFREENTLGNAFLIHFLGDSVFEPLWRAPISQLHKRSSS